MRQVVWVTKVLALGIWLNPAIGDAACGLTASAGLGCFDAEPTAGPAEPSAFRWLSEGKVLSPGTLALGLHYHYAHAPLQLLAPSADPRGRQIPVVKYNSRVEMRAAIGLTRNIDVSLAMPYTIDQQGTGSEALSSQRPQRIPSTGFSDMRLGFRTALPKLSDNFDTSWRLELTIPTGQSSAYLGEPGATEAVAVDATATVGSWLIGSELGVRFRKAQTFSDVALGTHPFLSLGVALRILERERLTLAGEGQLRPQLVTQPTRQATGSSESSPGPTWVMPTEWMLSVASRPTDLPIWLSLGAGTALPISFRSSTETHVSSYFFAPTSPRARVTTALTIRY